MASYKVVYETNVESDLAKVPFPFRRQLVQAIYKLKAVPRPAAADDLGGDVFRWVVHGWPIIYEVDDDQLAVTVLAVAPPTR